jgi:hypothetical protein
LSKEWWELHEYSWKDIETTLDATSDPLHLWQFLAAEGGDIPPTAIKDPWSQKVRLDYTDKAGALNKLLKLMKIKYGHRNPDKNFSHKLTAPFPKHVPPLPTQTLTTQEWTAFLKAFGPRLVNPDRIYPQVFTWRNLQIVPYEYCKQNKLLEVEPVMPVASYCELYGTPSNDFNTPFTYTIGSSRDEYYGTLGAFWIQLPSDFETAAIPEAF